MTLITKSSDADETEEVICEINVDYEELNRNQASSSRITSERRKIVWSEGNM